MTITLLTGDCRSILPTLASNSVHCVVTSPPYYGLRDYGTALWDGGDAECDHVKTVYKPQSYADGKAAVGKSCMSWRGGERNQSEPYGDLCGKCGARRIDRQLGLESSPDAYIATMVAVFREVRRVLRPDGVCFINMGDSYASSGISGLNVSRSSATFHGGIADPRERRSKTVPSGLKPKDLLMMPARLALALQADGWWLRSAIVWAKPNPMPESCTDRPTSAYEMVYLLAKQSRYFYDADAVRELGSDNTHPGRSDGNTSPKIQANRARRDGMSVTLSADFSSRNLRNVWTLPTQSFSGAHFATYPPALVERCIRAGTSERGCCAACGAPWQRITDKTFVPQPDVSLQRGIKGAFDQKPMDASSGWDGFPRGTTQAVTTGWRASCQCNADAVPCTVLDPFLGSGTSALVADRLQRHCIGIDLSTTYADLARNRIEADAPLFTSWAPAEDPEERAMRDLFAEAAE